MIEMSTLTFSCLTTWNNYSRNRGWNCAISKLHRSLTRIPFSGDRNELELDPIHANYVSWREQMSR